MTSAESTSEDLARRPVFGPALRNGARLIRRVCGLIAALGSTGSQVACTAPTGDRRTTPLLESSVPSLLAVETTSPRDATAALASASSLGGFGLRLGLGRRRVDHRDHRRGHDRRTGLATGLGGGLSPRSPSPAGPTGPGGSCRAWRLCHAMIAQEHDDQGEDGGPLGRSVPAPWGSSGPVSTTGRSRGATVPRAVADLVGPGLADSRARPRRRFSPPDQAIHPPSWRRRGPWPCARSC